VEFPPFSPPPSLSYKEGWKIRLVDGPPSSPPRGGGPSLFFFSPPLLSAVAVAFGLGLSSPFFPFFCFFSFTSREPDQPKLGQAPRFPFFRGEGKEWKELSYTPSPPPPLTPRTEELLFPPFFFFSFFFPPPSAEKRKITTSFFGVGTGPPLFFPGRVRPHSGPPFLFLLFSLFRDKPVREGRTT